MLTQTHTHTHMHTRALRPRSARKHNRTNIMSKTAGETQQTHKQHIVQNWCKGGARAHTLEVVDDPKHVVTQDYICHCKHIDFVVECCLDWFHVQKMQAFQVWNQQVLCKVVYLKWLSSACAWCMGFTEVLFYIANYNNNQHPLDACIMQPCNCTSHRTFINAVPIHSRSRACAQQTKSSRSSQLPVTIK